MIRITTLIENSPGEHLSLRHEHGLSFCIEKEGRTVLFDTGQSGSFIENAAKLRIDLSTLDCAVLSHGHYDHSGGLRDLITVTNRFELVVGKGFFNEKYAERNGGYEFLGNNFTEDFLKERRIRYGELAAPVRELIPGVFVLGNFPRIYPDELINPRFKLLTQGEFVPDTFDDEIMVVADTHKGLVALLGCSHPGMRNLLDAAKTRFNKPIFAVLGGTHLVEASQDSRRTSIEYLRSGDIGMIGVSHCTGQGAMNLLDESASRYFHNRTGSSLIIL
jgi:7,8-dihydropterin-6-yl-methyl-4-(beta-D-ribofuranosyl)aminobenzene 5'-phosphate synthase